MPEQVLGLELDMPTFRRGCLPLVGLPLEVLRDTRDMRTVEEQEEA